MALVCDLLHVPSLKKWLKGPSPSVQRPRAHRAAMAREVHDALVQAGVSDAQRNQVLRQLETNHAPQMHTRPNQYRHLGHLEIDQFLWGMWR